MPQPAKSRTVARVRARPSAARCPTRRRRRRPSSRPARRSGRGPCPRSRAISSTATLVGRAADRGRRVQRGREVERRRAVGRARRRSTSVARCITLGRCSTNGASGTFVEEQYGASDSATDRTAYSCSSRSFAERASEPARPRSRCVVAGTPDRAGQHPRGDQAALAPHEQLGGRAEEAVDVEGPAHRRSSRPAAAAATARRSARRAVATRSRASTTFSSVAVARCGVRRRRPRTPTRHRSSRRRRRPPIPARQRARAHLEARHRRRTRPRPDHGDPRATAAAADHDTAGTTSTLSPGSSAKAKRPEADQAGARDPHLVAHDRRARRRSRHQSVGVGEPVGTRRLGTARPRPSRPGPRRGAPRPSACSSGSRSSKRPAGPIGEQLDGPRRPAATGSGRVRAGAGHDGRAYAGTQVAPEQVRSTDATAR